MKFRVVTSTEGSQQGQAVTRALAEGIARMFPVPDHPEGVRRLLDGEAPKDATSVFVPIAAETAKV